MDLQDLHFPRKPLSDHFHQRRLTDARARHHKNGLAGLVADEAADTFQRLATARQEAVQRSGSVTVRRVQSDHPWKSHRAW